MSKGWGSGDGDVVLVDMRGRDGTGWDSTEPDGMDGTRW